MNPVPLIVERALELGFAAVGFVPVGPMSHARHLDRWLAEGMHGEMTWMEKHRDLRADSSRLEPGMRTIIALAAPYAAGPVAPDPAIARYALGLDYHDVLRARMRELAAFVAAETGAAVASRPAVDSAPVLERNVAVDAGIGWLGKSAMVLRQGLGSWTLLAELFVDVELEPTGARHPDRCGRCTRCIDLCPTGAIVAPYRVDARRCISYLTIELRGPIPRALRPAVGNHLFGCDICQSVCPWNRNPAGQILAELRPRDETIHTDARTFLRMSEQEFRHRFRGTPLFRTRRDGLARNAAVVLGNSGDTSTVPELIDALRTDPSALVRGHAAWALGRLATGAASAALHAACAREPDHYVLDEMRVALMHSGAP